MPIRLISENEKLSMKIEGVTFFYRRPLPDEIEELRDLHTSKGKTDERAFGEALLQRCISGWEGPLHDAEGKEAGYDPKLLAFMPATVQVKMAETISTSVDGRHVNVDPT